MQRLPEASDRKKGQGMCKEKGTSRQKEEDHSIFSSDQRRDNTLLIVGGRGWLNCILNVFSYNYLGPFC